MLVLEKRVWGNAIERSNAFFRHAYGVAVFLFGWLLFWVEDAGQLGGFIAAMFGAYGACGTSTFWEIQAWAYLPMFLVCAIASLPVVPFLRFQLESWVRGEGYARGFLEKSIANRKVHSTENLCVLDIPAEAQPGRAATARIVGAVSDVALVCILVLSVMAIVSGSYNPFIYFRF